METFKRLFLALAIEAPWPELLLTNKGGSGISSHCRSMPQPFSCTKVWVNLATNPYGAFPFSLLL
ncbi:MAG: hypothetical protein LW832_10400 [Parachlamydia sp.]|nr:hypothetical protein [Parachlamydia sp.]